MVEIMNEFQKTIVAIGLAMAAAGFMHSQLMLAPLWKASVVGLVAMLVAGLLLATLPTRADKSA